MSCFLIHKVDLVRVYFQSCLLHSSSTQCILYMNNEPTCEHQSFHLQLLTVTFSVSSLLAKAVSPFHRQWHRSPAKEGLL
ncbi:hypothetical protein FKM82_010486 [Ascaphus truei]